MATRAPADQGTRPRLHEENEPTYADAGTLITVSGGLSVATIENITAPTAATLPV